uniref:Uncharacterized protein n=1 Tax=Cacopsylla melanoneura TaxID=428564 RepID=A0A8D8SUW3_9HEMI
MARLWLLLLVTSVYIFNTKAYNGNEDGQKSPSEAIVVQSDQSHVESLHRYDRIRRDMDQRFRDRMNKLLGGGKEKPKGFLDRVKEAWRILRGKTTTPLMMKRFSINDLKRPEP